jgi:hypothetical protein
MSRNRVAIVGMVVAMVATMLAAGGPSVAGAETDDAVHGSAIDVEFVHETARLRQIGQSVAAGTVTVASGAGGAGVADERPFLGRRKHNVNAPLAPHKAVDLTLDVPSAPSLPVSGETPGLIDSWQGLNHLDTRYADAGNQFSTEPPDQGLCVGNGYVFETVNQVVQIYTEDGEALLPGQPFFAGTEPTGVSLNQALEYPPSFIRPAGPFGPFLFDPSCYFDAASNRWFHMIDNLAQDPVTGEFTGGGSLELAVSKTGNPLGRWLVYRIHTTNDGADGTPDHGCTDGTSTPGPCFADYPHIGADANGFYISVNEFEFFGPAFIGVNVYALSKADLAEGNQDPTALIYETLQVPEISQLAATLRPAQSRTGSFVSGENGTTYFLSAADLTETGGVSDKVIVWALTDTATLDEASPDPLLQHAVVDTIPFATPPLQLQKSGDTPLLKCINLGVDCFGEPAPFQQKGPYPIDALDGRMMHAYLQSGVLWGVLGTALEGPGGSNFTPDNNFAPTPIDQKAGVAYFAIQPSWVSGLQADVVQQGYVGVANGNLSMPSIAMGGPANVGFIGATLVGPNHFPSAVYVKVGLGLEPAVVQVAGRGLGPDDGFTGTHVGGFRPRWGDYGYAAAGSHGTVWFAQEYIAQTCDFREFFADPTSTCGFERTFLANWSTRIFHLKP